VQGCPVSVKYDAQMHHGQNRRGSKDNVNWANKYVNFPKIIGEFINFTKIWRKIYNFCGNKGNMHHWLRGNRRPCVIVWRCQTTDTTVELNDRWFYFTSDVRRQSQMGGPDGLGDWPLPVDGNRERGFIEGGPEVAVAASSTSGRRQPRSTVPGRRESSAA